MLNSRRRILGLNSKTLAGEDYFATHVGLEMYKSRPNPFQLVSNLSKRQMQKNWLLAVGISNL